MGFWINTSIAVVYFVLSVLNDQLNVDWHTAREMREPGKAANVSLAMGVIAWVPYVLLTTTNNWQIVLADLAGNWIGSYRGVKKLPPLPKFTAPKWPDHL